MAALTVSALGGSPDPHGNGTAADGSSARRALGGGAACRGERPQRHHRHRPRDYHRRACRLDRPSVDRRARSRLPVTVHASAAGQVTVIVPSAFLVTLRVTTVLAIPRPLSLS